MWRWVEYPVYKCPVCGEELEYRDLLYKRDEEIIGCSNCLKDVYAEDLFTNEDQMVIVCKECGEEVGEGLKVFMNEDGAIVGCEMCCMSVEAGEHAREMDEIARDRHEQMLVDERLGK